MIVLPDAPRILVIALRRLGDVLLTTPLIRSLRDARPRATIDVLVFADTAGILAGNPDIDRVLTLPTRPSAADSARLAARLFKRYTLAISTQSGDRPTLFATLAGRSHIATVGGGFGATLRRALLSATVTQDDSVHRVEEMLRLSDAAGVPRRPIVVPPAAKASHLVPRGPYAVIHAAPMFRYKQWTTAGWRALAAHLAEKGYAVVATGGPAEDERRALDTLWDAMPQVRRLDGRLDWGELVGLLADASVYAGPDTSVTHLAAATGCPTVALFGPTDPRVWGPWPEASLPRPWAALGTLQRRGNVWLVQNPLPCLPCQQEGCDRHVASHSLCLDETRPSAVIAAVDEALASAATPGVRPDVVRSESGE